jgi:negative regulator of sigma E activity
MSAPVKEERSFSQEDVNRIVSDRLERDRQTRAQVTHEPRVYALDSPHSFFGDVARSEVGGAEARASNDRLARYAAELSHEAAGGSVEGRRAERIIAQVDRHNEDRSKQRVREFRALATGGGTTAAASSSASVFVTPIFINDAWARFRGAQRTFANQCHTLPLAPYGMEAYIPAFSSTTAAAQQTEGSGVTETDPSTQLQGAPVVTISGQITLSQQLHDRGYAGGGSLDSIIGKQIGQQLEQSVDVYVLGQVVGGIPGAGVILDSVAPVSGNASIPNLYKDTALAREQITDVAGVRIRPTHIFSTSDLFSNITRQVDSSNRPIVTPQYHEKLPVVTGLDDGLTDGAVPAWARYSGLVWPGNVLWFLDDNIPASGSNTQIIVSAPDEAVVLLESPDPVLTVFPQTLGGNLQVIVNLRKYVCVINRHAAGSATITGNAYPSSLV